MRTERAGLIVRHDEAERALAGGQRSPISLVRHQHPAIAEVGVEFGQCEDHAVAIVGFHDEICRQRHAAQIMAGRRSCLAQDLAQGHALIAGLFAVWLAEHGCLARHLRQVGGGEGQRMRNVAINGERGLRPRHGWAQQRRQQKEAGTRFWHFVIVT